MRMGHMALAASLMAGGGAVAQEGTECAELAARAVPGADVTLAGTVPETADLPTHCRVQGTIPPGTRFELRLPEAWNGKFYMTGCGGFCGQVLADAPGFTNAMNYGLRRGYAAATMNGGHWGSGPTDARWAKADPVAEADWGYRSVEETTRVAKSLTRDYYGRTPDYAYFAGCSTGGRMANMAALRQPEAFDGIISGAPALDYPGQVGTSFAWIAQANTGPDGAPILTPRDAPVVADAVIAQCDADDGVADGMVSDPLSCTPDLEALDLAADKIEVLRRWYARPRDSTGEVLFPAAVPPGSEPYWGTWLTGLPEGGGALVPTAFGPNFLRYMAFPDDPPAEWSIADFDFDRDPARMAPQAGIYNSDDPDLGAFRDAGGKLLMYHGWADAIVFPGKTLAYWDAMTATTGDDFGRLFMIPGMDHCGIQSTGPGIDQSGVDPLSALEAWVEDGTAPERLMTTRTVNGETGWRRPVCAWPARATFTGQGDWRDPAGWTCEIPNTE